MTTRQTRKTELELLNILTGNAFDYFNKSIDEYSSNTKYAYLHLAISVELFMKARLMKEHWSLIFDKEPNITRLHNGDFKSVTLKDAIERINSVLESKEHIPKNVVEAFCKLSSKRNLIAHFCDPAEITNSDEVLAEQATIWYYLSGLLSRTWASYFTDYSEKLSDLATRMSQQAAYLDILFETPEIQGKIQSEKNKGCNVYHCPACKHDSVQVKMETEHIGRAECLVCHYKSNVMRFICEAESCNNEVIVYDSAISQCECGKIWDIEELKTLSFVKECGVSTTVNCLDCDSDDSVREIDGKPYFCLSCFTGHDEIHQCEWCSEYYTGKEIEDSYLCGCGRNFCEGSVLYKSSGSD